MDCAVYLCGQLLDALLHRMTISQDSRGKAKVARLAHKMLITQSAKLTFRPLSISSLETHSDVKYRRHAGPFVRLFAFVLLCSRSMKVTSEL